MKSQKAPESSAPNISIGISECLLGNAVRYNGGHKHSKLCSKILSQHFEFVPTCPEVAIGLGVPREPIRLVEVNKGIRVQNIQQSSDVTEPLHSHGHDFLNAHQSLSGFIFTQNSPSCGLHNVKVYHQNGNPLTKSRGAFASAITEKAPYLPVEEAGRLNDPLLRETFVTAVFAYHDWQINVATENEKRALIEFHARNKLLLMSHSIESYKRLGNLIADLKNVSYHEIKNRYLLEFMKAIKTPTSRGMHCNAMEHIQGYLKKALNSQQKQSLNKTIHEYRKGYIPLVVPITLLKHYSQLHQEQAFYACKQSYLNPHPYELGLRNDI